MDARLISVAAALVLIALVGAIAAQLGGQQEEATPLEAEAGAESNESDDESVWITTTTTTSGGEVVTTTLTRTGPTVNPSGGDEAATTTAITTITTTVTGAVTSQQEPQNNTADATSAPGPIGEEGSMMAGEVVKIRVDKTVKAGEGWVTVKAVTLSLDGKAGILEANASLVLPDPCWKAKATLEVEAGTATLTIYLERSPVVACIQVISDSTLTVEAPSSSIPGQLKIVVVVDGDRQVITVDVDESLQPKAEP